MSETIIEENNSPRRASLPAAETRDIKLDALGAHKLTVYLSPAIVEAMHKDQSITQHTTYQTHQVNSPFGGTTTQSVPVNHIQSSSSYDTYFVLQSGEKVHRTFSVNPNFIAGYRAILVDGESKTGKGRYPVSVLNLESKRPFFWPDYEIEGLGIFKKQFWPIRSYLLLLVMTFILVPMYEGLGVVWLGVFVWAAINFYQGRQNRKIYEKLRAEIKEIYAKYK